MGYHRAGFTRIVGIDIEKQKRYPFEFIQADALEYVREHGHEFDAIHASPPCQDYSSMAIFTTKKYPRLIEPIRNELKKTSKPYVIENVERAKRSMNNPFMLCGTMFGLEILRHRLFEVSPPIYFSGFSCHHYKKVAPRNRKPNLDTEFESAAFNNLANAKKQMGIDWMTADGLREAIPPAYTEFIGKHLINHLNQISTLR